MVEKLKECPFCGGNAYVYSSNGFSDYETKVRYDVGCGTKFCMGTNRCKSRFLDNEEAIARWNTRHQPTEVSELQINSDNRKVNYNLLKENERLREALLWAKPYVARLRDTEIIDKALTTEE